jgi:hypothetical protein
MFDNALANGSFNIGITLTVLLEADLRRYFPKTPAADHESIPSNDRAMTSASPALSAAPSE